MTKNRTTNLHDAGVDVKIVLSGLWVSMLFVFAYVDIFGFWRAVVINGALHGRVPRAGFAIDQTFLALTTVYILIPSLMVAVSLLAPARINRTTNVVVSLLYVVSVVLSILGEPGSTSSSAASSRLRSYSPSPESRGLGRAVPPADQPERLARWIDQRTSAAARSRLLARSVFSVERASLAGCHHASLHSTAKSDAAGRYRLRPPPPGAPHTHRVEPDMLQAQSIKIFTTTQSAVSGVELLSSRPVTQLT